jgi:hypothetical protein
MARGGIMASSKASKLRASCESRVCCTDWMTCSVSCTCDESHERSHARSSSAASLSCHRNRYDC